MGDNLFERLKKEGVVRKNEFVSQIKNEINTYMDDINIPTLSIADNYEDILTPEDVPISKISSATNLDLERYLEVYGGFKSYVEVQLGMAESEMKLLEGAFEEGLAKEMYSLSQHYAKRPTKEFIRGEALQRSIKLETLRKEHLKAEAVYTRLLGLHKAYTTAFQTVSRLVALREASKDQI